MAKLGPESSGVRTYAVGELWQACSAYEQAVADEVRARHLRDAAIRRAKAIGLTLAEIADIVGVSKARVQQITPGDEEPEQLADQRAIV